VINPAEARWVNSTCNQDIRYNQVTCQDENLEDFINEVNGLRLNAPLTTKYEVTPAYIPILDSNTLDLPLGTLSHHPVVGIGIKDIVSGGMTSKKGIKHESKIKCFNINYPIRESLRNKKVILFCSGHDTLIENLWYHRNEARLFENFYAMNLAAVAGINFSVFVGECPVGHLINQNKSLEFALLTETKSRIPAIPHIYAINKHHIDRWTEYFQDQTNTQLIYINAQKQKSEKDKQVLVTTIKGLMNIRSDINVLLEGFPLHEVYKFGHLLQRMHFAEKMPIKKAQSRVRLQVDPKTAKITLHPYSPLPQNQLIAHNVRQRQAQIELQKKKVLPDHKISKEITLLLNSPGGCICANH
jgi:hypothetical protein